MQEALGDLEQLLGEVEQFPVSNKFKKKLKRAFVEINNAWVYHNRKHHNATASVGTQTACKQSKTTVGIQVNDQVTKLKLLDQQSQIQGLNWQLSASERKVHRAQDTGQKHQDRANSLQAQLVDSDLNHM